MQKLSESSIEFDLRLSAKNNARVSEKKKRRFISLEKFILEIIGNT